MMLHEKAKLALDRANDCLNDTDVILKNDFLEKVNEDFKLSPL